MLVRRLVAIGTCHREPIAVFRAEEMPMTPKRTILILAAATALVLFGALQASGYNVFDVEEEGDCAQCHTTWPGAEHDFHTAEYGCATCHTGAFSDPVPVSVCSACHEVPDVLELHGPLEAPNGQYCGLCHEGVAAESHSYTEIKALF